MHTNQLIRRAGLFAAAVTMSVFAFSTMSADVSAQTPTGTATATATATASPSGATGATTPAPAKTGNAGLARDSATGTNLLAVTLLTATFALAGTGWVAIGKRRNS